MTSLDPSVPKVYTTGLVITTDTYQFLYCPGSGEISLQIGGATVDVGFGVGAGNPTNGTYQTADETYLPVLATLERQCDVIRFKSHTKGVPATLTVIARPVNG